MANKLYPLWKQELVKGTANTQLTGALKVALVDTGTYTYSDSHQFLSSVSGIAGTPVLLADKTFVNGVLDASDSVLTSVSNGGVTCEALILFIDTGNPATSTLVCYLDTGITNMPVTPNGGDISIAWNVAGIFAL